MALFLLGFALSWPLIGTLAALILARELWNLTYFKRHGIGGPMPLPFVGNILQWLKGIHLISLEYRKQYEKEKVVGAFMFSQPVFFVNDLDMIKDITIKQFSKFMNHKQFVLKSRPFHNSVTSLRDQHWKDVRNVITPTFSAAKMKPMASLVNECCDNLVANFGELQQHEGHVKPFSLFEKFTMDGIAKCAFGLQVDSQNNPDDPFITNAKKLIGAKKISAKLMIAGMFPPIGRVMDYFEISMFPPDIANFFTSVIDKTIEMRNQSSDTNRKDFLQLMIDVEKDDQAENPEGAKGEHDVHSLDTEDNGYFDLKKTTKTRLTRDEIYAQALFFFFAGYETTNITLGCLAYSLATNPDVQERLIEEIDDRAPSRDSVNYGSIANMPYLDCVVCETLRIYPAATITERECNETYRYDDVTIPNGSQVFIPVMAIHRDPSHWPNPMEFDPNRFTKENREGRHPFAWIPFGAGPRNCIGMRFALMEVKMAIVRLLQKFRFETSPETEIPLPLGRRSVKPDNDVILRVVERN